MSKQGTTVGASWGAVRVPDEADSPREALQLADLRMYAQKESRRVARGSVLGPFDETPEGAPADKGVVEA
jgi:hypothetical protein